MSNTTQNVDRISALQSLGSLIHQARNYFPGTTDADILMAASLVAAPTQEVASEKPKEVKATRKPREVKEAAKAKEVKATPKAKQLKPAKEVKALPGRRDEEKTTLYLEVLEKAKAKFPSTEFTTVALAKKLHVKPLKIRRVLGVMARMGDLAQTKVVGEPAKYHFPVAA